MVVSRWDRVISTVLLGIGMVVLATEARAQAKADGPPALEGPLVGEPLTSEVSPPPTQPSEPDLSAPLHDALRLSETRPVQERAPKSPPPPVTERPSTDRPDPQARWFGGYWSWDPARDDFVWISGAWRVPPAGSIWVEGRWMRDDNGWYRVPGVWSQQRLGNQDIPVISSPEDWRQTGPPTDRPAETPGAAPGPNYFYVPGQYVPTGNQTTWKSGFWAQAQLGWDWVPARWTRQADGWRYREGYWTRDTSSGPGETRRHSVARPADLPPAIVESEPANQDNDATTDSGRDVIADAERDAVDRTVVVPPGVVVDPRGRYGPLDPPVVGYGYRSGMPYRMIRPPSPLYGPAGVVVPNAVPPFVQRLLNRVLP